MSVIVYTLAVTIILPTQSNCRSCSLKMIYGDVYDIMCCCILYGVSWSKHN